MASSWISPAPKGSNISSIPHINTAQLPSRQLLDSTQYTVLSIALAVITVCFPKRSALRRGFLLLQIALVFQAFLAIPPTDVPNTAVTYTFGILLTNFTARFIDRLYLHVPETEFHRIKEDGTKEDATKLSGHSKFLWAFELLFVTRGVGWNWQVSGIPKQKPQTRSQFLAVRLAKYIAMYAGLYIVGLMCQNIRNEFASISYGPLREGLVSVTQSSLFLYHFIVLGYAIAIYSHFGMWTLPLSLLCVGLKVGPRSWQKHENWPPNFGSLNEAYSVRRFWGYAIHAKTSTLAPRYEYTLTLL